MNSPRPNKDLDADQSMNHHASRTAEWFTVIESHFENFHIVNDCDCQLRYDKLDGELLQQIYNLGDNRSYDHIKKVIAHSLYETFAIGKLSTSFSEKYSK